MDRLKKQELLSRLRVVLARVITPTMAAAFSYIVGRLVNISSVVPTNGFGSEFVGLFDLRVNAWNLLTWIALFLLAGLPLSLKWLRRQARDPQYVEGFVSEQIAHLPPGTASLVQGTVSWGSCLTIQLAPFLRDGWKLSEVRVQHAGRYPFPRDRRQAYLQYRDREKARLAPDNKKYGLKGRPFALTDMPSLSLTVGETLYSEVQFFRECIATTAADRDAYVTQARNEGIRFPNAFCLHLIIVTADGFLLLTRRSIRLAYNPGVWSMSIEEQMAESEFGSPATMVMRNWVARLMQEELGLSAEEVDEVDVRILSVFVETDILNCAIAGVAYIPLTRDELDAVLRVGFRQDQEFDQWEFIREESLVNELVYPSRPYHTTAPYRMLLLLASRSSLSAAARLISRARRSIAVGKNEPPL